MKRELDISFSDQAESIIQAADLDKDELVEFLIDRGGFVVGGNEVIAYIEQKDE